MRVARIVASPQLLVLAQPGQVICCETTVPTDAKYVRSYYDPLTDLVNVVVEHESFDDVQHGQLIPEISGPFFSVKPGEMVSLN